MPSVMEKPSGILSRSRTKAPPHNDPPPNSDHEGSDEEPIHDSMIRVGADYQAVIPDYKPGSDGSRELKGMLVWAPNQRVSDAKLDKYIAMAKDKHGYNIEQALGMLLWHKHDVDKSLADLANFTPFPDEWSLEDKVLFEQAFSFHGKSFSRIQQMLPDKLIPSLVKFYYSWKKTRTRTSLMDRQARRGGGRRDHSNDDEQDDPPPPTEHRTEPTEPKKDIFQPKSGTTGVVLGGVRKEGAQYRHHPPPRHTRRPPRGMRLRREDVEGVSADPQRGAAAIRDMDRELEALKRQVQRIKQLSCGLRQALEGGVEALRPPETPSKLSSRWSTEEQLLAVQALRRYGRDFPAVSAVLGTKTAAQVRAFVGSARRRFGLHRLLPEPEPKAKPKVGPEPETRPEPEVGPEPEVELLAPPHPHVEVVVPAVPPQPPPPPLRPALPPAPLPPPGLPRPPPPLQPGRSLPPRQAPPLPLCEPRPFEPGHAPSPTHQPIALSSAVAPPPAPFS